MNAIKVLLANDHLILRNGIKIALTSKAQNIQVVGEADSFAEILRLLPHFEADILMTDDIMPGGEILTFLPLIKEQYPDLKIIINSMLSSETADITKMMEWANGWLSFISKEEEFAKAVEVVFDGRPYYYKSSDIEDTFVGKF